MAKTLGDYLLNGGLTGRKFYPNISVTNGPKVIPEKLIYYEALKLIRGRKSNLNKIIMRVKEFYENNTPSRIRIELLTPDYDLFSHFYDQEYQEQQNQPTLST